MSSGQQQMGRFQESGAGKLGRSCGDHFSFPWNWLSLLLLFQLPLPLMELMETEVLDILKKALITYRSTIGRNHFMTKELQGYIEGIRKRRNKRLYFLDQ